jgi:hypothetical protein
LASSPLSLLLAILPLSCFLIAIIRRLSSAFSSSSVIFVNRNCSEVFRSVSDIDIDDVSIDDDDNDDDIGGIEDASLTFNFRTVPILELIL